MRTILFLILTTLVSIQAIAGQRLTPEKELAEIMAWLRQADGYSYHLDITSSMKNGDGKLQKQDITIYLSTAASIRYISSKEDLSFMNKNGFFKVLRTKREAGFKQFTSDSMSRRAMAAVAVGDAANLADSILLRRATIVSKENKNGMVHYRLKYDPGYMITSFDITFDTHKKVIVSVAYSLERPMDARHPKESMAVQQIRMSDYRHEAPAEVQNLISGSADFRQYLSTAFPDYTLHNL